MLARPFSISRGTKTYAEVVTVSIETIDGRFMGECVPYARYGESVDGVLDALRPVERFATIGELEVFAEGLRGAARNALSSAIFAALHPERAYQALVDFDPMAGARTIVLGEPDAMADDARETKSALLKVKLKGDGRDLSRIAAIRAARPDAPIWVDANEGLDVNGFCALAPHLASLGVVLVEQPLAAGAEIADALRASPITVCADEAFHDAGDVERVVELGYRAVNVKLDKAGGGDRALEAARVASAAGLEIVVGCMVSSSLSIAPAWLVVKTLRAIGIAVPFIDLDGATFLAEDRPLTGTGWQRSPR
jgi:L-Ala-D/L-Glu epimerase / N-acetyl-D-glutamate racemase